MPRRKRIGHESIERVGNAQVKRREVKDKMAEGNQISKQKKEEGKKKRERCNWD